MAPETPIQIFENINILMRIIVGLVTIFGSVLTYALLMHFKWKRKVDDHREKHAVDYADFKRRALDQMEQGTELITSHTNALNSTTYRLDLLERKQNGLSQRMRELITDHNERHKAHIEPPPISE